MSPKVKKLAIKDLNDDEIDKISNSELKRMMNKIK
jgi:hypothetical protein